MKKRDEVLSESIDDLYYGDEPDYSDELSAIENGGYDEFRDEEYDDPQMAAAIHQAAQEEGLSDLDYVNQQEFFDDIIDSDPEDGPYIVDIEESDGYSEFICDDNGNPNLEDARPIYDDLVSGKEKGMYGSNCKDDPWKALNDVIEGYDMMVSDAMLGRNTLSGALKMLYKFKDNPNCPKTKAYFNALANYAEQINNIATSIGASDLLIEIPGKFNESRKRIKEGVENMKKLTEGHSWDDFSDPETDSIEKEYLPDSGEGETMMHQAVTAATKLIYKWFNDGDVFDNNYGLKGWANDLSSYANWLDENIPEAEPILARIKTIGSDEDAYTDLLYDLMKAVFNPNMVTEYAGQPKTGTIYDCDGPYNFYEAPTCPECGQECDEWDIEHYGMCSDCYNDQYNNDEDEEEDDLYESKKITRKTLEEARKAKKKEHKAYKMKEDEEADWAWDLKTEKKALRKSMPAASDNEITIKAAGNIAKKFHTTRAKILATLKPSNNIKGAKTWNKEGKVLVKESRENLREEEDEFIGETSLTDYQKEIIKEWVKVDFECGHPSDPFDSSFQELLREDNDFVGVESEAANYYAELVGYGPAGFLEMFRDEFDDWDPDFLAEYGSDDDYDETSSTLDDNDWDEEDDPLYGYGEDDNLDESTKKVNESMPTRAEYFSKEAGRKYAEDTIETEDDILCNDDEIRAIAASQGADAEPFLEGYKDFVTDWLEVPTGFEGELPPEGYEDDFYNDFEEDDPDEVRDMGEMYGVPRGATPEEALKFFESEKATLTSDQKSIIEQQVRDDFEGYGDEDDYADVASFFMNELASDPYDEGWTPELKDAYVDYYFEYRNSLKKKNENVNLKEKHFGVEQYFDCAHDGKQILAVAQFCDMCKEDGHIAMLTVECNDGTSYHTTFEDGQDFRKFQNGKNTHAAITKVWAKECDPKDTMDEAKDDDDKDCKGKDCDCKGKGCKDKKEKLDEISDEDLAKIVVAYKANDPDKKPLKDGQGKTYSVPYDEDKSDKDNVSKLKRLLRQSGISETSISSLRFRKTTA